MCSTSRRNSSDVGIKAIIRDSTSNRELEYIIITVN